MKYKLYSHLVGRLPAVRRPRFREFGMEPALLRLQERHGLDQSDHKGASRGVRVQRRSLGVERCVAQ